MKLCAADRVKAGLDLYGTDPSKSLGQNFLIDDNVIEAICDGSHICEDDLVVEIGPGLGVLTAALAERAGKVVAVEIDSRLVSVLETTMSDVDNLEIVNGDILKTSLKDICGGNKIKVVGNLPYYITTPIIMKLLREEENIESITAMMQKEVAERIGAVPSTKAYGAITLAVDYYCRTEQIITVPSGAFRPSPKVDSAVLRLDVREKKPVALADEELFFQCIKASFQQRRKILLNCLAGFKGIEKDSMREILTELGVDPRRRGETLTIEEFAAIANAVKEMTRG